MNAKYEIVLQFALAPRDVAAFNRVMRLEEELAKPSMLHSLDGHDCTAGQIEIYLQTDDPVRSFESLRGMIPPSYSYRASYRELNREREFERLREAADIGLGRLGG